MLNNYTCGFTCYTYTCTYLLVFTVCTFSCGMWAGFIESPKISIIEIIVVLYGIMKVLPLLLFVLCLSLNSLFHALNSIFFDYSLLCH